MEGQVTVPPQLAASSTDSAEKYLRTGENADPNADDAMQVYILLFRCNFGEQHIYIYIYIIYYIINLVNFLVKLERSRPSFKRMNQRFEKNKVKFTAQFSHIYLNRLLKLYVHSFDASVFTRCEFDTGSIK